MLFTVDISFNFLGIAIHIFQVYAAISKSMLHIYYTYINKYTYIKSRYYFSNIFFNHSVNNSYICLRNPLSVSNVQIGPHLTVFDRT